MDQRSFVRRIVLFSAVLLCMLLPAGCGRKADTEQYREKADLLKEEVLAEEVRWELVDSPAGEAGYAVFVSVCDTSSRARVYTGTGKTPEQAWENADRKTEAALAKSGMQPEWVKADLVYISEKISMEELSAAVKNSRPEFFRYGVSFDDAFRTALLEAELNGAKIYDYEEGGIDLNYLNTYLKKAGRKQLKKLPEDCTVFRCFGWFCGGENAVVPLSSGELDYGRREVELLDADYAAGLIRSASDYLIRQVREDGSFVYGYYPRFDNEIENYNIVRHASTIWSLLCRYRMDPDEELAEVIERIIGYLLTQVVSDGEGRDYLYEEKDDEIKLGGCGVAVIALTEYMDVFQNDKYLEECRRLGKGILSMLDQETGEYVHVLNGDFTLREAFRTVYYDGEATFALCRLYGLTGEREWLDAACSAVDHFIEADYTGYRDHWVAYTMNEITRYVTDRPDYFAFALQNAQRNLQEIYERDTTYHTYLELLMATFEIYDRLVAGGASVEGFDLEMFLRTIYERADRMLNGYFYPETAMYMENPQRILNTFMVRHDGYRVRIDDVQHNIGGFYLYWKNYDRLAEYGMLDCRG